MIIPEMNSAIDSVVKQIQKPIISGLFLRFLKQKNSSQTPFGNRSESYAQLDGTFPI